MFVFIFVGWKMLLDEEYMLLALDLAGKAYLLGECPVGAIVVDENGIVIGEGYNRREIDQSPTAHAEVIAIEKAAAKLGSWRLGGCTIYVTLEPCPMCAGAISNARIKRLVYGAFDEKGGACASLFNMYDYPLNHKPLVRSRILAQECGNILSRFFQNLRS